MPIGSQFRTHQSNCRWFSKQSLGQFLYSFWGGGREFLITRPVVSLSPLTAPSAPVCSSAHQCFKFIINVAERATARSCSVVSRLTDVRHLSDQIHDRFHIARVHARTDGQ